jgi:hypothetical protein
VERIELSLVMDLSDTSAEGAGWYLEIGMDGKALMAPMPVTIENAFVLANDFYRAMQTSPYEMPQFSPIQVVQSGSQQIQQTLQKQLEYAESQAAKIKTLRAKLAQTGTQSQESHATQENSTR